MRVCSEIKKKYHLLHPLFDICIDLTLLRTYSDSCFILEIKFGRPQSFPQAVSNFYIPLNNILKILFQLEMK